VGYKDPEKQREYQRDWQRMKRAGRSNGSKASCRTLNSEDIRNAEGLRDLMAEVIAEVRTTEADPLIRARCIGYLVSIALKSVETADLEARLTEIEQEVKFK